MELSFLADHDDDEADIEYRPERTMSRFHKNNAPFRWVDSALGQGKTGGMVNEVFRRMYTAKAFKRRRQSRWIVVRATYGELETILVPDFQEWIPEDLCTWQYKKPIIGTFRQELLDGSVAMSELMCVGMDNKNSMSRIAGKNATGGFMNELTTLQYEVYVKLMERCGRWPGNLRGGMDWGGIIGDYNKMTKRHWFYREVVSKEASNPDHQFFSFEPPLRRNIHGDLEPNPYGEGVLYQPLGYEYWLRLALNKPKWYVDSMILNRWVNVFDGEPVHDGLRDEHISPVDLPAPDRKLHLISFDWGRQMACVIGYLNSDGTRVVTDAIEGKNMTLSRFLEDRLKPVLKDHYAEAGYKFVGTGDPSAPTNWASDSRPTEVVEEWFRANGYTSFMMNPSINDIEMRLAAVDDALAYDGRVIMNPERTIPLQDALNGGYFWEDDKYGNQRNPCKGEHSHVADAFQYWNLEIDALVLSDDMAPQHTQQVIQLPRGHASIYR